MDGPGIPIVLLVVQYARLNMIRMSLLDANIHLAHQMDDLQDAHHLLDLEVNIIDLHTMVDHHHHRSEAYIRDVPHPHEIMAYRLDLGAPIGITHRCGMMTIREMMAIEVVHILLREMA